jgi:oligoribonuclease (3'-5' exoribonuclease)
MTNKVTKIFSDMTDEELVLVIAEMKEDDPQGIIRENGIVRSKCKMVHNITGGNIYEHLMMVQISIIKEAAYRFTPTMDELTHTV